LEKFSIIEVPFTNQDPTLLAKHTSDSKHSRYIGILTYLRVIKGLNACSYSIYTWMAWECTVDPKRLQLVSAQGLGFTRPGRPPNTSPKATWCEKAWCSGCSFCHPGLAWVSESQNLSIKIDKTKKTDS